MTKPSRSFIDECEGIREWAEGRNKSTPWGYKLVDAGLPVVRVPGMKLLIHPPTADEWLRSRMTSKRKPAKSP